MDQDPDRGLAVVGHVIRADGAPVPGAAVTLTDLNGSQLDRSLADRNGVYHLVPRCSGSYIVICLAGDRQPRVAMVNVDGELARHDIQLAGAGSVRGTVRRSDSDGREDPVTMMLLDVHGAVVSVIRTSDDGSYAFDEVAEGTYTVTAAPQDRQPAAVRVTVSAGSVACPEITLPGPCRITGTVWSASTGKPVDEALVTIVDSTGARGGAICTGPDGSYAFDGLAEGSYTIIASGLAPASSRVLLSPGAASDADLVLAPPRPADV